MKVCHLAKVDIGSAGRLDSSGWIWNQQQVTLLTPAFHCFQCQRLYNEWQILQTYNYVQNIKIKLFLPSNWWIQNPRWFSSDFLALETSAASLISAASTTSLTRNCLYSPISSKNFPILMINGIKMTNSGRFDFQSQLFLHDSETDYLLFKNITLWEHLLKVR